jgi:hypothetical protein
MTNIAGTRQRIAAIGVATAVLAAQVVFADNGAAALAMRCRASVSKHHPSQYSDVYVYVKTLKHARVTTSAAYRTTTTNHSAHANRHGDAAVDYYISDATPGYKVKVSVTVRKHGRAGYCSTWFTPHSR